MGTIKKPSDKLAAWLKQQLKEKQPGERLPTDRELGSTFNLSRSTVKRVVSQFVKKGLVVRIPGKGSFLPQEETGQDHPIQTPSSSAEVISASIYQSICSGDLKNGEALPPIKYMSYRFRVSASTVIAAYKRLQEAGHITKVGKTFWVGAFKNLIRAEPKREVYLFNYRSYDFTRLFQEDMLAYAYQKMERELLTHGRLLRFENSKDWPQLYKKWLKEERIPAGIIFSGFNSPRLTTILPELKYFLDQTGENRPRVLLEWLGGQYRREMQSIQLLTRGSILTMAANALARFIIQQKYREAVIFIDEAEQVWNFGGFIHPLFRIIRELYLLDPEIRLYIVVKTPTSDREYQRELQERKIPNELRKIIENERRYVKISYKDIINRMVVTGNLQPSCRRFRSVPLWVFTTDALAEQGYRWAQRQGVKVPDDLSLVVLENNPRYFHLGLTYCGPDWEGIGYLMAHTIIGDFPIEKTNRGFIKTKAIILEKLTTK
jgi:DNA-binding transcriptional regulator YhcF (GntR family)